jgi:AraC family transcriptional regulator
MDESRYIELDKPRFETRGQILFAGSRARYTEATMGGINAQWERIGPHLGSIPGGVGRSAYGVIFNMWDGNDSFDYMAGVEVSDFAGVPAEYSRASIAAQRYVVFPHRAHVSKFGNTVNTILAKWMPQSGHELMKAATGAPDFFEVYLKDFNPQTGLGGMEVWMPIKA